MGNLKCIQLSERNQSERDTYCMIPMVWFSGKDKIMEILKNWWLAAFKRREGEREMTRWSMRIFRAVVSTYYPA